MLSNKRLVSVCAVLFCSNLTFLILFVKFYSVEQWYITINDNGPILHSLPDDFLSIGIDTSEIENYSKVPFNDARFKKLASELSPARLRLGGTMSERLIFYHDNITLTCESCQLKPSHKVCSIIKKLCKKKFLPFFLMNNHEWDRINRFCRQTKLKLLFSFNVMIRNGNFWNPENAKDLLEYSRQKDYRVDWQLGNEPNSFPHTFNVSISPKQLAHDFKTLRALINEYGYNNSLLVGPDTTRPQPKRPECLKYMVEFLNNGSHYINVMSWHQYYLNSRTAKLADFFDPSTFELLRGQIAEMINATKPYKHFPMWLTETSSSYGGGAPGLSNSFAGTPLWLDKLGMSAEYNITTVVRQSFYGGNYSLIDNKLNPLPDWWVSVLYKKLVGNKVLKLEYGCSQYQRIYAHCTSRKYTNDTSAVTIFGINLEFSRARFLLNGSAWQGDDLLIDEYVLRPPSNNRKSKQVLLNGFLLSYKNALPKFKPNIIKYGNRVTMPPYSVAFWVVKNTKLNICN